MFGKLCLKLTLAMLSIMENIQNGQVVVEQDLKRAKLFNFMEIRISEKVTERWGFLNVRKIDNRKRIHETKLKCLGNGMPEYKVVGTKIWITKLVMLFIVIMSHL